MLIFIILYNLNQIYIKKPYLDFFKIIFIIFYIFQFHNLIYFNLYIYKLLNIYHIFYNIIYNDIILRTEKRMLLEQILCILSSNPLILIHFYF